MTTAVPAPLLRSRCPPRRPGHNHGCRLTPLPAHLGGTTSGAAQSIANSLGGVGPFFRPPYGEWNSDTVAAARSCRLRAVVLWSVSVNKGFIATHGGPIKTGDIILMHFREELYTDLQAVFAELDRLGLSVARLEDYLPAA